MVTSDLKLAIPSVDEMAEAGVYLGHKTNKWDPRMKPYISGVQNLTHLIDLDQTSTKLAQAIEFLKEAVVQKKTILFVGTSAPHRSLVQEAAEACAMPYVNKHWVGGILTNFKVIGRRLEYFRDLEKKRAVGELEKYTKKEQLEFAKIIEKLQERFGGIKNLTKTPDALLVVNCKENMLAVKEARKMKIMTVGLCDTNIDPRLLDYPIPANDDAISSVKLILDTIVKNII